MCGIVGYIGKRRVVPIVLEGLKRLEYRGYDSAGIVFCEDGGLQKYRCKGKLAGLEEVMDDVLSSSRIGLGHTRWATHGAPSEANSHPHTDCTGELAVVHNGIVENYQSLRQELIEKGHKFQSETDTEVLAHLIEEYLDGDLVAAVRRALARVEGSFAVGVIWAQMPDTLIAARSQSPLILGVDDNGSAFMASDIPALLPYTKKCIFLDDGEYAVLQQNSLDIFTLDKGESVKKEIKVIDWNPGMAEKAGYKHFMLKEIFEQPQAILSTIRERFDLESGKVDLPEIGLTSEEIKSIKRISFVACGTSWHAALVAKSWIEKYAGIPVEVDIASEFRYKRLLLDDQVLVVPISQSGETADTLAGMKRAKKMGAKVVAICNVLGSTVTREADGTIYTHAGPEIGVASTKAFTTQLTALLLLAIYLGKINKSLGADEAKRLGFELVSLPEIIEKYIPIWQKQCDVIAEKFSDSRDFLYLGRGLNFPIALEGALKLKEISYIHAEGYAAGELKHGPIALVDKDMPVLALAPRDDVYGKLISNVEEVKARRGRMILVGSEGDGNLSELSEYVIRVPEIDMDLSPLIYVIPLQLLSYQIANLRGCDVDQPRNLAKSVTVE